MKITKSQKEAIHATKGNVLVHAGAGAGKSSSFTARIAHLIKNEGVAPERVLGLTFTNEAAENMRTKLSDIIGASNAKRVTLLTFHSFAYRLLKSRYASEYANKTIIKHWWKTQKMYDIVGKNTPYNNIGLGLSCQAGELSSFISYQKSNMVRHGMDIIMTEEFETYGTEKELQSAFDIYCEQVRNARVLEFDDMITDLYYKLVDNESLLFDVKDTYDYVMVDEFQDTNTVNLAILKLITDNNLFVVGDFRQGIYGFINANVNNILDFQEDFNDVKLIEMRENFRSTKNIVGFANDVIDKSPIEKYKQFDTQVAARDTEGDKVRITAYVDEYQEASEISNTVQSKIEGGMSYNDFAILFRTNAQLGFYEMMFADLEIPVDVSNGRSFFDRKEISDLLSYAEHTINPDDDMSMRKIMNSPSRFISKSVINDLDKYAYNNGLSFEEACLRMSCGKPDRAVKGLVHFFEDLREGAHSMNASTLLKKIYKKTKYAEHIEKTAATNSDLIVKTEAVNKLFQMAKKFASINSFLGHVSVAKSNSGKNSEGVKLMTVHASKGLEFPYVFIPSSTDENFPHEMNNDIEEERRLFYVASSRAMDNMEISYPVFTPNSETATPSPFLKDVIGVDVDNMKKKVVETNTHKSLHWKA